MAIEGEYTRMLANDLEISIVLCENGISMTLTSSQDGEEDKEVTAHLTPLMVGEIVGLLLAASETWTRQIIEAAEATGGENRGN